MPMLGKSRPYVWFEACWAPDYGMNSYFIAMSQIDNSAFYGVTMCVQFALQGRGDPANVAQEQFRVIEIGSDGGESARRH
ncbi:MAG: hypothetical protein U0L71_01055 [Eggerthellaceae bacterium]|nr:hypothetical protein [Eggerthellaceae bacterium]